MKSYSTFALLSIAFSSVHAITLHKRDGVPRVLGFDLSRRDVEDPVAHDRNRMMRRDSVSQTITNEQTLYFFNATLGSPRQNFSLHLDTGSSDLWVNSADSSLCSRRQSPCAISGTYDANSSLTYNYVNSDFNISYVDGSGAAGDYATDTFRFSNQTIENFQFGIGYDSSSAQGVLGIGYTGNEVQVQRYNDDPYDNLPARLASDGVIASNAYSLYLNDVDSNTGTILFGGVDRDQYIGDLVSVPIQKTNGEYTAFRIELTGVDLDGESLASDTSYNVVLDSGSSLTYLPPSIVNDVYDSVEAVYEETQGIAYVPCDLAQQDVNMTFYFADPANVSVSMSELVLDLSNVSGDNPTFSDSGESACMFGIAPAPGPSTIVLGDTFLRSAYVVYDLENNEISLAQSDLNATSSDIVEIGSGKDAVPSASGVNSAESAETSDPSSAAVQGGSSSGLGLTIASCLLGVFVMLLT